MGWKSIVAAAVASGVAAAPRVAEACGCFAPPTVGEPVVQAGERIVFAHRDGMIVAHIQIQYQGEASDFAWLLPLPSVPELRIGTEELFAKIEDATQPTFTLTRTPGDGCGSSGISLGCGSEALSGRLAEDAAPMNPAGVAVKQSSAGPYDYAVLDASSKQPMLDWLRDNQYFVPAGTEDGVDPYIREGAYFLALKLRAGQTTGDLSPVILEYASERPMIPIILTAVAANPDMGILVWVLGSARAIPHNYQHVLINEEFIDWPNAASNYAEVVTRAIDESEQHHAFVTEFAGSTAPMLGLLDAPSRFNRRGQLEAATRPHEYVALLQADGFWPIGLVPILSRELDIPASAFQGLEVEPFSGLTIEDLYWQRLQQYAGSSTVTLDSVALTAEIWERVVEPALAAGELFRENPKMTRLFTTMSPEEMTEDPVFAFNPDLPEVSNLHAAELITHCDGPEDRRVELELNDQRVYYFASQEEIAVRPRTVPVAAQIEILGQEGPPQIVVDNKALLAEGDDLEDGGCIGSGRTNDRGLGVGLVFGLVIVMRLVRRRTQRG
jgi:hypothetical protein